MVLSIHEYTHGNMPHIPTAQPSGVEVLPSHRVSSELSFWPAPSLCPDQVGGLGGGRCVHCITE